MSKQINNGGSVTADLMSERYVAGIGMLEEKVKSVGGLSLRDYFAAAALQSAIIKDVDLTYLWHNEITGETQNVNSEYEFPSVQDLSCWKILLTPMQRISIVCYKCADAMLAARKEGGQP